MNVFGKKKKKIIELESDIRFLKQINQEKENELVRLRKIAVINESKIRTLMDENQTLSRSLDLWIPLADRIASIEIRKEEQKFTIPQKGIFLLRDYEKKQH